MSVGKRVREIRNHYNLKQYEFSETIGISSNLLSEIEGDKKSLSKPVSLLLQYRYNINLDWLESGVGEMLLYKDDNYKTLSIEDNEYFIRLAMIVKSSLEYYQNNEMPYNPGTMTTIILVGFYAAVKGEEMPKELKRKIEERLET